MFFTCPMSLRMVIIAITAYSVPKVAEGLPREECSTVVSILWNTKLTLFKHSKNQVGLQHSTPINIQGHSNSETFQSNTNI